MGSDRREAGERPSAMPPAVQVELPVGRPGRQRQSPAAMPPPNLPDLGERARRALARAKAGDYKEARHLLDALLSGRDRVPVPAAAASALTALADGERLPAALRAEATALLAEVTEATDGHDAAWELLEGALTRWPENPVLQAVAAVAALRAGDLDRARELVTAALAGDPGCAEALAARGRLELADEQPQEAIETARALSAVRPCLGRALLAMALAMANRLDEDPGLVDAVLADLPPDAWALEWGADMLYDADRLDDARRVLDRLLQIRPDDAEAHWSRGVVWYALEDYQAAARDLDFAASRISDPELTALRGEVAYLTRDYRGAVDLFSSIDEADQPAWAVASLGWSHLMLNEPDAAHAAFDRALRSAPDDVDAIYGLAQLAVNEDGEDTAGAGKLLRHALELNPADELAHLAIGELHYQAGQYEEALKSFDEALRLQPKDAIALGYKGMTVAALDDTPAGIRLLTKAARQEPAWEWAIGNLTGLLESHDPGDADGILDDIQRAAEATGASTLPVLTWRGWLAARQRRWEDAERCYRQARKLAPDDEDLTAQFVSALRQLWRPRDALAVLKGLPRPLSEKMGEQRAALLWQSGNNAAACAELRRMPPADQPSPWMQALLGELDREEGRRTEARRSLQHAVTEAGDDIVLAVCALNSLAIAEDDDSEPEAACAHLRQALDLRPDHGPTLGNLAWHCLNQGDAAGVTGLLDQSDNRIAANPALASDPSYANARADAFYGLGDYASALNAVNKALSQSGTGAGEAGERRNLLLSRGWAELALGQAQRAGVSFLAAARAPGPPESLIRIVTALARVGHYHEALHAAARAENSRNPFAGSAAAAIWLRLGDWQTAARYAAPGDRLTLRTAETAYIAARALRMAGRQVKALEYAQLAHAISPHAKETAELAECLSEAGRGDEAEPLLTDVLSRLSRQVRLDADGFALQGWCLLRLRRTVEAGKVFLRALSTTDKPAEVLLDLVLVSALDGDLPQVRLLADRAGKELARLPEPTRHGALALVIRDLTVIRPWLSPETLELTDPITADFHTKLDGLRPALRAVSHKTTFQPSSPG